ncbi:MAG: response regulator [Phycisphaerae bacterium]
MKKKRAILVADDERDVRRAVGARLSALGYRVIEAASGLAVLTQHLTEPIDVVILDHHMPTGDGRSIARVIRNERAVPIVFLSGQDREHFRELAMELPDVYYLPKPLDWHKLETLLDALVRPREPAAQAV